MNVSMIRVVVSGTLALAPLAWSQEMVTLPEPDFSGIKVMKRIELGGRPVAGSPYSADEVTRTVQTFADGNRIVTTSTVKVYRDPQGRTRVEETVSEQESPDRQQSRTIVNINDTTTNTHYVLHPESRTAEKTETNGLPSVSKDMQFFTKLNAEAQTIVRTMAPPSRIVTATLASSVPGAEPSPAASAEDLGSQSMEGVQVHGKRTTLTIPAGAIGNDRPIAIVDERWYSPELQMNVMTKHSDPRMGETVFSVTNVNRAEPDASLFQLPPDYQVTASKNLVYRVIKSTKE